MISVLCCSGCGWKDVAPACIWQRLPVGSVQHALKADVRGAELGRPFAAQKNTANNWKKRRGIPLGGAAASAVCPGGVAAATSRARCWPTPSFAPAIWRACGHCARRNSPRKNFFRGSPGWNSGLNRKSACARLRLARPRGRRSKNFTRRSNPSAASLRAVAPSYSEN